MVVKRDRFSNRVLAQPAVLVAGLLCAASLSADAPSTVPARNSAAAAPARRSLLAQLDNETQALWQEIQPSVARVQLPPPHWMNDLAVKENPLEKWASQLDPAVRAKLEQDRAAAKSGRYTLMNATVLTPAGAATQPSGKSGGGGTKSDVTPTGTGEWKVTTTAGSNTVVLQSPGGGSTLIQITGGTAGDAQNQVSGGAAGVQKDTDEFAPNNVALVLDDRGHLLVPIYIEKDAIGEEGVKVSVGDQPAVVARFVASDRQTNITVLKLATPSGQAVKLSRPANLRAGRPMEGSLVLLLSPSSGAARLMVWTGPQQDLAGVVVAVDGTVSGFARYGQFLPASAVQPVAQQLIDFGRAKRAKLGISIHEVRRADPLRLTVTELGSLPALRVEEVALNSAAAKSGLLPGDFILSLGEEPVGDPPAFAAAISACSGKATLHLLRAGKRMQLTVELKAE